VKDTAFWDVSSGSLVDKIMKKESAESPRNVVSYVPNYIAPFLIYCSNYEL